MITASLISRSLLTGLLAVAGTLHLVAPELFAPCPAGPLEAGDQHLCGCSRATARSGSVANAVADLTALKVVDNEITGAALADSSQPPCLTSTMVALAHCLPPP